MLRALEPMDGIDHMRQVRSANKKKVPVDDFPLKNLCSGPSKFCQALHIDKPTINELDLTGSDVIWLEEGLAVADDDVIVSTRIGIEGAGPEAAAKPWRFYVRGNAHVSKRDRKAEQLTATKTD